MHRHDSLEIKDDAVEFLKPFFCLEAMPDTLVDAIALSLILYSKGHGRVRWWEFHCDPS